MSKFARDSQGPALASRTTSRDSDSAAERGARSAADKALAGPSRTPATASPARGSVPPPPEFGSYTPIPRGPRERLEAGFGQDLGFVRLHSGPTAALVARSVSARALALGDSIVFGSGQLDPVSQSGMRLLAHEVSHVLEAPPGDHVGRREVMAYPDITGEQNPPGNELYMGLRPALASAGTAADEASWKATVASAVDAWVNAWHSDPSADDAKDAHAAAASLLSIGGAYDCLKGLAAVQSQLSSDKLAPPEGMASAAVYRALTEGMAGYVYMKAEGLSGTHEKWWYYFTGLTMAHDAVNSAEGRYQLELEGTLNVLVDTRADFNQQGADKRALGERIGVLGRRALLLSAAIEDLRQEQRRLPANSIAGSLVNASGRITTIRSVAETEAKSRAELDSRSGVGTGAAQLAVMPIPVQLRTAQTAGLHGIAPETALPETTDQGVKAMLFQVERNLSAQENLTRELHDAVVPPKTERRYTLPEFARVFRRWSGFFSPEQERQDPQFRLYASFFERRAMLDASGSSAKDPAARQKQLDKLRTPYELAGVPTGVSAISGASARAFMMWLFVDRLADAMSGTTTEFSNSLPPTRVPPIMVTGSATQPTISRTSGFDTKTPDGTVTAGPILTTRHGSEQSARRFSDVANSPSTGTDATRRDLARLVGPGASALKNPDAALIGIRAVSADEGWTYLVDVWEDEAKARNEGRFPEIVAREQRTMPPEVVRYILAQKQLNAIQKASTVPRLPSGSGPQAGAPVGDAGVRSQGLEAATAINAATAIGRPAVVSPEVRKAADHLAAARQVVQPAPGDLVAELRGYLDDFLVTRSDTTFRVAAVLVIAQAEHGITRTLDEAVSPGHFLEVAAYAGGITFGTAVLENLGPLGKIANIGINGYLQANNCSTLASVAGLAMWMHKVAGVSDLNHARAYAFVSQAAIADLVNLMDEVVSRAATKTAHTAITRISQGRASTPRSLVSAMGEIARSKGAKEPMLAEVSRQLGELSRAGKQNTAEYRLLEAMQVEISQIKSPRPEVEAARDSAIQPSRTVDLTAGPLLSFRLRTEADIAPLREAVPSDLRARVRVVQDPLLSGKSVQSVPLANEVQIRVGPEATVREVMQHLDVARDQARFTGTLGRARLALDSFASAIDGRRKAGTRGIEAQQEINKLGLIAEDLRARQEWMEARANEIDHPLTEVERANADAQLRSIETQIELHSRDLASYEPGRGFVAAVDSRATVRDALLRQRLEPAEVRDFVRELDKRGHLDAFAQLVSVGTYQRLRGAGLSNDTILAKLAAPDGYGDLVRADLSPDTAQSRTTLGGAAARALVDARNRRAQDAVARSAVDRLRTEWAINAAGDFSETELKNGLGLTVADVQKHSRTATPSTEPRILWRWKRYVDRMGPRSNAQFARWAKAGFQVNANREGSSPFEPIAVRQVGGFLNNDALGAGGQRTYDYGEWVNEAGRSIRSGVTGGRRPSNAADFVEVTTRPDGIRPRVDGGFDVIEHKHMTAPEGTVFHDSLQLRAQREMAAREGRGRHELILSSDFHLGSDGLPMVRPYDTVANAPGCTVYYLHDGRITHTYNPGTKTWDIGQKRTP